ncbi:NUDIX hydrolase [Tabrizicola flagellatus]|uniref:NUDIX hydrolase n=1 Tax=Tabrizicola flagellatus TaxID=2593021 RepID=UPI0011F39DC0|nr:NUDIX hydrolase [Tabrizicola flagellatus]
MSWQDKFLAQGAGSGHARVQYGALCWREGGDGTEVLLITSRNTGRWVIPKGWPMPGLAPEAAAAQEAWEEAGVSGGLVSPVCVGRYGYQKVLGADAAVPCAVAVYGLKVSKLSDTYPEANERRRKWFPLAVAAGLVNEPDLGRIIAGFTPPEDGRPSPIAAEEGETGDPPPQRSKRGKSRGH